MANMFFSLTSVFIHLLLCGAAYAAKSSILLEGAAAVISVDRATNNVQVLYNSSVLVTGNTIVSVYDASKKASIPSNTTIVPCQGKIITPGFIDTHRHLWQTAFKGLASNTSLAEYFFRYSMFSDAKTVFTPEDIYVGQLTGIYESLNSGVTSILDHAHHTFSHETSLAGLQASVDSGARIWWSFAFYDLSNATWTSPYTRQAQIDDFTSLSSQKGPAANSSTVSIGMAYDYWGMDNATQVNQIIDLAKYVLVLPVCCHESNENPRSQNISVFTTHYLGGPWNCKWLICLFLRKEH